MKSKEAVDKIIEAILVERERQDERWGEQNHHPFVWLTILGEEVGEANKAVLEAHFGKDPTKWASYVKELVQVAAVSLAMLESYYRNPVPGVSDGR